MLSQMKSSVKKTTMNPTQIKNQKAKTKKLNTKEIASTKPNLTKKAKSKNLATDLHVQHEPTHAAGHQKMNLQTEFGKSTSKKTRMQSLKSMEQISPAENIRRKESPQRRLQYPNK